MGVERLSRLTQPSLSIFHLGPISPWLFCLWDITQVHVNISFLPLPQFPHLLTFTFPPKETQKQKPRRTPGNQNGGFSSAICDMPLVTKLKFS